MSVCTLESEDFHKLVQFIFIMAPFMGDLMASTSKSGGCVSVGFLN